MTTTIVLYLLILLLALILFGREIFPLEISALLILVLLVGTGILEQQQAFASFGSDVVVLIASLFVLIAGLTRTGVIKHIEDLLISITGKSRTVSFLALLVCVAIISAFISNTATLAVTIPIVVSMSERFGDSPRRWLMPIAFVSVLGGMNSLIGTSTNLIISGLLPDFQLPPFELFTTTTVALPILLLGGLYLLYITPRILQAGSSKDGNRPRLRFDIRPYTSEVRVLNQSPLCNRPLGQSNLFSEAEITVLGIVRGSLPLIYPRASTLISPGDHLIVEGNIDKLTEITGKYGLRFVEEVKAKLEESNVKSTSSADHDLELHEVLVSAASVVHGRTPSEIHLRNRYRISLIAINRQGTTIYRKLSEIKVLTGDILVVQFIGPVDNELLDHLGLVPLHILKKQRYRAKAAPAAVGIFIGALAMGSLTPFPMPLSCLMAALLLVMTKILKIGEVYEAIEWRVLIFIGAILCLGHGMVTSGTAQFLAQSMSQHFTSWDSLSILAFFLTTTVVLTNMLSNQATAVIMIPLAITTANQLGVSPMPLIMAVTIGASCCFMTPFEPSFLLVLGPGGYRFRDFIRVGLWLNLIVIVAALYLIPIMWPL